MKPKVLHWDQIEPILSKIDVIEAMKQGFINYSKGLAKIPPVGELIMEDPPTMFTSNMVISGVASTMS